MKEITVLSTLIARTKYGINITDVLNILDSDTFKEVADGNYICGVIQTPEAIVPVIDLNYFLNEEYTEVDKFKSVIIVKQYTADTEFEVGLLVDNVNGTYDIFYNKAAEIEKIVDDYDNELPTKELTILDPHAILNRDEKLLALKKYYRRTTPVSETFPISTS